jgi:hypothetical protein
VRVEGIERSLQRSAMHRLSFDTHVARSGGVAIADGLQHPFSTTPASLLKFVEAAPVAGPRKSLRGFLQPDRTGVIRTLRLRDGVQVAQVPRRLAVRDQGIGRGKSAEAQSRRSSPTDATKHSGPCRCCCGSCSGRWFGF